MSLMMMTDPITPPPELVAKWASSMCGYYEAARWGADTELEACCEWLDTEKILTKDGGYIRKLRAARRPKPPTLKEQALAVIEIAAICDHLSPQHKAILRRALEQLDD
jgi:hypothetical protein